LTGIQLGFDESHCETDRLWASTPQNGVEQCRFP
jgi:hypothetical protein